VPLGRGPGCTPCTCFKAKTAEQYAGCLASCAKVNNKCPPQGIKAPTDQTGLGQVEDDEPGVAELAELKLARDLFQQAVNGRFAGGRIRVRLLVEPDDEPDFAFTR